jgi:hypothetical protein
MTTRWLSVLGFLAASAAASASAETVNLTAALSGANEVPPVQGTASGTAAVALDTASRLLTWEVQVQGLSAPISAAHFHGPSSTSANAPVVIPIAKAGDTSPFKGSTTITPEQMADLLAGRYYLNIHTPNNPPGEIRGQVAKK